MDPRLFFLVSHGRAGTTLVAEALAAHPEIALTNEAKLFDYLYFAARWAALPDDEKELFELEEPVELRGIVSREYSSAVEMLFAEHARSMAVEFYGRAFPHKRFRAFGDKMPHPLAALAARALFPDLAVFAFVRDPRDYLCSARAYARKPAIKARYPHLDVGVREHLTQWRNVVAGMLDRQGELACLLRYEELVQDPGSAVDDMLAVLGLESDPACTEVLHARPSLADHGTAPSVEASVGRWRGELNPEELELVREICGSVATRLGYGPLD